MKHTYYRNHTSQTNLFVSPNRHFKILTMFVCAILFGMATVQMAKATNYIWTNTVTGVNWSSSTNWSPNAVPLPNDNVTFTNIGNINLNPATVTSIVDNSFQGTVTNLTIGTLSASPSGYIYDVVQIPTGKTLTVVSNMVVGGSTGNNSTLLNSANFADFVGGGTLKITGPLLEVEDYGSGAVGNNCAYLNLTSLTNFVYNNINGTVAIAGLVPPGSTSSGFGSRIA